MYIERPVPFYGDYPFLHRMEPDRDQERELRVMKSYFSGTARMIQELVEQECDRLEYDGSMMFDDYPDKLMMEHLCRRVEENYMDQVQSGSMEMQEAIRSRDWLRDLVGVMLYNEMYRRRCRRRHCRHY